MNTQTNPESITGSTPAASPPESSSPARFSNQHCLPAFYKKIERNAKQLARFNRNSPRDRFALERLRRQVRKAADHRFAEEEVVHRFKSPKVIDTAARWAAERIAYFRQVYAAYSADNRADLAEAGITLEIGKSDGFFFQKDEHTLIPELGLVVCPGVATGQTLLQSVIDAVRDLAGGQTQELILPESLPEYYKQWRLDLLYFLRTNGDDGRQEVLKICQNPDYARSLHQMQDTEVAPCLQFLARRCLELQIRVRMPSKNANVLGFAPNS